VLIDFENVQPDGLAVLSEEHFKLVVFVGATQVKVPFELASAMQGLGERAQYVKIAGNGPNALDFHIAFYIGHLAAQDENAFFHIISKDTGFDPLIQHLKSRKILAGRVTDIIDIPILKMWSSKSSDERLNAVIAKLLQMKTGRPSKVATLSNTITSLFQKQLTDVEIEAIIQELQSRKLLAVKGDKIAYMLPSSG